MKTYVCKYCCDVGCTVTVSDKAKHPDLCVMKALNVNNYAEWMLSAVEKPVSDKAPSHDNLRKDDNMKFKKRATVHVQRAVDDGVFETTHSIVGAKFTLGIYEIRVSDRGIYIKTHDASCISINCQQPSAIEIVKRVT